MEVPSLKTENKSGCSKYVWEFYRVDERYESSDLRNIGKRVSKKKITNMNSSRS